VLARLYTVTTIALRMIEEVDYRQRASMRPSGAPWSWCRAVHETSVAVVV